MRASQPAAPPTPGQVTFTLKESGLLKFDGMPDELPVVGEHVQQFARHMDQEEFVGLFLHFRGKKLSRGASSGPWRPTIPGKEAEAARQEPPRC